MLFRRNGIIVIIIIIIIIIIITIVIIIIIISAQNGNLEVSLYFVTAKEGYTVRKMGTDKRLQYIKQTHNTPMEAHGGRGSIGPTHS
jgi:hypothetical protein